MENNEKDDIFEGFFYKVDEDEDWAYYHIGDGSGKLYRIRKDGTDLQQVMDANCCEVNIIGDWIYHCRCDDGESLHKIRKNGTELTKLNDDYTRNVNVAGDWIYYCADGMNLYKIRIDGTKKTKLNDDACQSVKVIGDWVYYGKLENYHGVMFNKECNEIYRIRTDGTQRTKLGNADKYDWFSIKGEWIYYFIQPDKEDFAGAGELYRMRLDGTGIIKLLEKYHEDYYHSSNIKIEGEWMYVLDTEDDTLCKIRTDGIDKSLLVDQCDRFRISGDWIYYSIKNPGHEGDILHKIRKDGTDSTEIDVINRYYSFDINGDWVYYFNQNGIFKTRPESRNSIKICDDIIRRFEIIGDWIYYEKENDRGAFCRIRIDGGSREWFPDR